MSNTELTKAKARELITPIVDDEVDAETRQAFMDFIAHHDDVRSEYESIKKIKSLVSTRCPYAQAPDSLKKFVQSVGEKETDSDNDDAPIYDMPGGGPGSESPEQSTSKTTTKVQQWIYSAAASLLIVAAVWGFFNFYGQPETTAKYNVEEYAY